jgi:BirA family biotin operon repressor/biotin-[acetyl-CoA-carboxylase] ligase
MLYSILKKLADGKIHDVKTMIQEFSLTFNEVDSILSQLKSYGIAIRCFNTHEYQLAESIELFEKKSILSKLSPTNRHYLQRIDIFDVINSTNHYLWQSEIRGFHACLAEYQTAGRGRQGKSWISAFAKGVCLSIKNTDLTLSYPLTGLNIALAVTVARVLRRLGAQDIGLKWPNDVWWKRRKLAGLLLESRIDKNTHTVVWGIGINIFPFFNEIEHSISQAYIDLCTILGHSISRNALTGELIEHFMQTLLHYKQTGLSSFLSDWQAFDLLRGNFINVNTGNSVIQGIACGIDESGALLVQSNGLIKPYFYSDVSVKFQ